MPPGILHHQSQSKATMASLSDGLAYRVPVFGLEYDVFIRQKCGRVAQGGSAHVLVKLLEGGHFAAAHNAALSSEGFKTCGRLFFGEATLGEESGSPSWLARALAIEGALRGIDTLHPNGRPDCSPLYRKQPTLGARCADVWEIVGDSKQTPGGELSGGRLEIDHLMVRCRW